MKYTSHELSKKFAGKYINVYPHHYDRQDSQGNWITVYEVRSVRDSIQENHNLPEDVV